MSGDERKLVDTPGEFLYAVRNGEAVTDPQWNSCRLVVTDERLVIASDGGKQTLPHSNVDIVDREVVPDDVDAAGATPLAIGDNVVLLDATGRSEFEREYWRATLHGEVVLVTDPAVVDGVVRDDAEWRKTRFRLEDDTVRLGFPGGGSTTFSLDDADAIETTQGSVMGEDRTVVEVSYIDDQDRSVETHFSGMDHHTTALESLFERTIEDGASDYELSETENQVLMALYSDVSPFEMADFVGISVDEVEEIYGTLLDVGAVDEVRTRTEVALNEQGRNLASKTMSEE